MNTETLMQISRALRGIVDRGDVKGFESMSQIVGIVNLLELVVKTTEEAAEMEKDDGTD